MGQYLYTLRKSRPVTVRSLLPDLEPWGKVKVHRLSYLCKPWRSQYYNTDGVPPVLNMQRVRGEKAWAKHEGGVFFAYLDSPKATDEYDTPKLLDGAPIYYADRAFSEWWDCGPYPYGGRQVGVFLDGKVVPGEVWDKLMGQPGAGEDKWVDGPTEWRRKSLDSETFLKPAVLSDHAENTDFRSIERTIDSVTVENGCYLVKYSDKFTRYRPTDAFVDRHPSLFSATGKGLEDEPQDWHSAAGGLTAAAAKAIGLTGGSLPPRMRHYWYCDQSPEDFEVVNPAYYNYSDKMAFMFSFKTGCHRITNNQEGRAEAHFEGFVASQDQNIHRARA